MKILSETRNKCLHGRFATLRGFLVSAATLNLKVSLHRNLRCHNLAVHRVLSRLLRSVRLTHHPVRRPIPYFLSLIGVLLICSHAQAEPFKSADANAGKALALKHCISCHASRFGGDGSGIYTRDSRIVTSSKKLVSQIRNCNTMLGLKWFEDEELNVAKYLNQTYYKFSE